MAGDVQINCDGTIVGTVNPMPVTLQGVDIDTDGSLTVANKLIGTQVGTTPSLTWANSSTVTTYKMVDFTHPTSISDQYAITVTNPSTVTNLVMNVFNVDPLGTATDTLLYGPVTISKWSTGSASSFTTLIHGWFNGDVDGRLKIYNDTALGASDTFSASVRIRELM